MDPASPEIYTLSLHDALPIFPPRSRMSSHACARERDCPCSPSSRRHAGQDRKSTRLNSSHVEISYAVFCLKKKNDIADALRVLSNDALHLLAVVFEDGPIAGR